MLVAQVLPAALSADLGALGLVAVHGFGRAVHSVAGVRATPTGQVDKHVRLVAAPSLYVWEETQK